MTEPPFGPPGPDGGSVIRARHRRATPRFGVPRRGRSRPSFVGRKRVMAAPRKYPDEFRERATRIAVEARRDPTTRLGALARIGKQLGINPETLRNWGVPRTWEVAW